MNHKVMLIEDDFTMRSLLRTLLRYEGYDVATVENDVDSDAILALIRNEAPVVILMDVHLRNLNGIELLQTIRKEDTFQSTGIIMSSGSDMRERCLEYGADAFILKPYMPEDLIQKINQVMMNHR
jgi:CheY-like chemotaxis protein